MRSKRLVIAGFAAVLTVSACGPPAPAEGWNHSLRTDLNYFTTVPAQVSANPYLSAVVRANNIEFITTCNHFSATIISNTELEWFLHPTAYCPDNMENQELLTANMFESFHVYADDAFKLGSLSFRGREIEVG